MEHSRVRGYTKIDNKDRYRLHKKLKKQEIKYNARQRKIFDFSSENIHVETLIRKYGYVIENKIL